MEKTVLSGHIYPSKNNLPVAIYLALGLLGIVISAVVLIIDSDTPEKYRGEFNWYYVLACGLILLVAGILLQQRKRVAYQVQEVSGGFRFTIFKKGETLLTVQPHFTTDAVWYRREIRRGIVMRDLYLTLFEYDNPVLTLNTSVPLEEDIPADFRFIDPLKINFETGEGKPRMSNVRFGFRKLLELNELVTGK